MVFDLVSGVVVGPDFVGTFGLTNNGSGSGDLRISFFFLNFPEFGSKNVHGNFPILLLGSLLTDVDDDS